MRRPSRNLGGWKKRGNESLSSVRESPRGARPRSELEPDQDRRTIAARTLQRNHTAYTPTYPLPPHTKTMLECSNCGTGFISFEIQLDRDPTARGYKGVDDGSHSPDSSVGSVSRGRDEKISQKNTATIRRVARGGSSAGPVSLDPHSVSLDPHVPLTLWGSDLLPGGSSRSSWPPDVPRYD